MEILNNNKSYLLKGILALAIIMSLYFAVKTIAEIKKYNYIGEGTAGMNTINFEGKGEVTASPDLATISFTIRENAVLLKDAQDKATAKEKLALDFLDKSGIAKKDIKAESYNSYPQYDYGNPCYSSYGMSCTRTRKITGYEVSEYVSVKVRDLTKAGDIVKGIGAIGISEMNGPDFSIEKEDELKAQARKLAIDDAKAKAEVLAHDLGVKLVRIVNFSENGYYPMPMYASGGMMAKEDRAVSAPAPQLPTGENKITSNISITYEIR